MDNYYTRTEADTNFSEKMYLISNINGYKGNIKTSDSEAYNALIYQINRYLNTGFFSLKAKHLDANKYPYFFVYDIVETTRDTSRNIATIKICAKCLPSGYRIENSTGSSYGVNYANVQLETAIVCYVPLAEFDSKQITDIYDSNTLSNKGMRTSSIYEYYVFKGSNLGVLGLNNTTAWTPTGDYNPATKKYVDDIVGNINTTLSNIISGGV